VEEATTDAIQAAAQEDLAMLVWWATEVECASALARLEREGFPVVELEDRSERPKGEAPD